LSTVIGKHPVSAALFEGCPACFLKVSNVDDFRRWSLTMYDAYLTERRGPFLPGDKLRVVMEAEEPGISYAYVARRNGISTTCLNDWRRQKRLGLLADDGPAFVPIQVSDDAIVADGLSATQSSGAGLASGRMEIDLGDNRCIRVDRHVDTMALRRVLDALGAR
jgi:transposase